MKQKRDVEYFMEWIRYAKSDIEASKLLYGNMLFPQSLYFLHQAIEKIDKCILIHMKCIDDGKELGHKTTNIHSKIIHANIMNIITEASEKLSKEDQELVKRSPSSFSKLFHKEDLEKLKDAARHYPGKRDIPNLPLVKLTKDLNYMDKEVDRIIETGNHIANFSSRKSSNYIKLIEKYERYKRRYALGVVFRLSMFLPNQDSFRYPEFEPVKIYNKRNILVRQFGRIVYHLSISCILLEEMIKYSTK